MCVNDGSNLDWTNERDEQNFPPGSRTRRQFFPSQRFSPKLRHKKKKKICIHSYTFVSYTRVTLVGVF